MLLNTRPVVKLACHILIRILEPLEVAIVGACCVRLCLRSSGLEIFARALRCDIRCVVGSYQSLSVHALYFFLLQRSLIRIRGFLQVAKFAIVRLHIYLRDYLSRLWLFFFLLLLEFLLWLDTGRAELFLSEVRLPAALPVQLPNKLVLLQTIFQSSVFMLFLGYFFVSSDSLIAVGRHLLIVRFR